jgi:hypothetical protein
MSPRKSLTLVVASSLTFCALGAFLGFCVAAAFPEYYESVLRNGTSPAFRPIPVAIGLGAIQGAGTGVAVGLSLVCLFIWKDTRDTGAEKIQADRSSSVRLGNALTTIVVLLLFGACTYVAYLAGGMVGQVQVYGRLNSMQVDRVNQVLASGNYPRIEAGTSKRYVFITGEISSAEALAQLNEQLAEEFGRPEAKRMTQTIEVSP